LRVPKDIIPGHGPIFEGESRDVMAALFRLATRPEAAERSVRVSVKASPEGEIKRTEQRLQRQPKTGKTLVTPAQATEDRR
jgi:hypothetical protein